MKSIVYFLSAVISIVFFSALEMLPGDLTRQKIYLGDFTEMHIEGRKGQDIELEVVIENTECPAERKRFQGSQIQIKALDVSNKTDKPFFRINASPDEKDLFIKLKQPTVSRYRLRLPCPLEKVWVTSDEGISIKIPYGKFSALGQEVVSPGQEYEKGSQIFRDKIKVIGEISAPSLKKKKKKSAELPLPEFQLDAKGKIKVVKSMKK